MVRHRQDDSAFDGHCPFINQSDTRCSSNFAVARMQYAFDHCFADYATCPTYRQLMIERRASVRQGLTAQEMGEADGDATADEGRLVEVVPAGRFTRLKVAGREFEQPHSQARSQIDPVQNTFQA
jgi:hypothetical protein